MDHAISRQVKELEQKIAEQSAAHTAQIEKLTALLEKQLMLAAPPPQSQIGAELCTRSSTTASVKPLISS